MPKYAHTKYTNTSKSDYQIISCVGFQAPLSRPNYRRLRSQAGPAIISTRRGHIPGLGYHIFIIKHYNKNTHVLSFFVPRLHALPQVSGPVYATLITNTTADHCAPQTRDEKTTPRHSRTRTAAHPRTSLYISKSHLTNSDSRLQ